MSGKGGKESTKLHEERHQPDNLFSSKRPTRTAWPFMLVHIKWGSTDTAIGNNKASPKSEARQKKRKNTRNE